MEKEYEEMETEELVEECEESEEQPSNAVTRFLKNFHAKGGRI